MLQLSPHFCVLLNPVPGGGKCYSLSALNNLSFLLPPCLFPGPRGAGRCLSGPPPVSSFMSHTYKDSVPRGRELPLHHLLTPYTKPNCPKLPNISATSLLSSSPAWVLQALTPAGLEPQLLAHFNKAKPDLCKQVYSSQNQCHSHTLR